jgi:tape measure domain-containing protein
MTTEAKFRIALEGIQQARAGLAVLGQGFGELRGRVDQAQNAGSQLISKLRGIVALVGIGLTIKELVSVGDAMATLGARLKVTSKASEEFVATQEAIYRIAQKNSLGIQEVSQLFTKLSGPVSRLGGTTRETAGVVEAFSLALKLGGADAASAASAVLQFGQAMGSGALRGDEFNAISEASPRLLQAIAEGANLPIEGLKKLGSEGKLTAELISNALLKSLAGLKGEAADLPDTVSNATTRIKNDWLILASTLNDSVGLNRGLSALIETLRVDFLPIVKDEAVAAFATLNEWITKNKESIEEAWFIFKETAGEIWGAVKAAFALAGEITGLVSDVLGVEKGVSLISVGLIGVRYIVAGIKDGVELLSAVFASIGSAIAVFVYAPILAVMEGVKAIVGLFNKDMATAIGSAQASMLEGATAGFRATANVADKFLAGGGAVEKLGDELDSLGERRSGVRELSNEMDRLKAKTKPAAEAFKPLKGAVQEADKAAASAAKSAQDYIRSMELQGEMIEEELRLGRPLNDAEKARIQLISDLGDKYKLLSSAQILAIDNAITDLQVKRDLLQAQKDEEERLKAILELQEKERQHQESLLTTRLAEVRSLEEKAAASELQLKQVGLTKDALNALEVQQLRNEAAAKRSSIGQFTDPETAELLNREADALERQANAMEAFPGAEKWQATYDLISDGLSSALGRGAKSGWQFLIDLFKSKAIEVFVQPIAAGLSGTFTDIFQGMFGGTNAQGGQGLGFAGAISKLFDAGKNFQTTLGQGVTEYAAKAGEWLVNNTGGLLNKAGSSLLSNSGTIGKVAGGAGTAFAARGLSQAISGGYSVTGGNTLNNIAGVASLIPAIGPIAGVITGAINRLFGRKAKELVGSGFEGSLSGGEVSGSGFNTFRQKGGLLRSDKITTEKTALSEELASVLKAGTSAVFESTKSYAAALKLPVDSLKNVSTDIKVTLGKDEEANKKAIAEAFGKYGDALIASFSTSLTPLLREGEKLSDGFARIGASMATVNPVLELLGLKVLAVDKVGTEAASRLIELAGGVEGFSDATNSYYQNFFSEGEQTQAGLDSISAALAEVGLAMPKTRGEFRALVQSLDLTTESGQKQFIALMGVNAAFAQLVPAVESATDKIKGSAKELLDLKDRLSTGIEDNLDSSAGPEAQLRRQYERIAESLNSAGIAVDVEGLMGLSKQQIQDYAQALMDSNEVTFGAKEAVVDAALALLSLKDNATEAAEALSAELKAAIDDNIGRFLTAEEQRARKYQEVQSQLSAVGVDIDLGALMGASKKQIFDYAKAFVLSGENSEEAKIAIVKAAGALGAMRDEFDETTRALNERFSEIILDSLKGQDLVKFKAEQIQGILSKGGLDVPLQNILSATQDQVIEFFNAVGIDGKNAILDAYGPWKDLQEVIHRTSNAIKEYRENTLAEAIEKEKLARMKPEDRVKALRKKEGDLFKQLGTAEDPVAIAGQLQQVILDRINEEVSIREKSTADQKAALEAQIAGAEKLKSLSADIAQFTGELKFSALSPLDARAQAQAARDLYSRTLVGAQAGDENATGNLLGNARAYLEEAASAYASGPQYVAIFNEVMGQLEALGLTGAETDPAVENAKAQLAAMEETATTSSEMLEALLSIDAILAGRQSEVLGLPPGTIDPLAALLSADPAVAAAAAGEGERTAADPGETVAVQLVDSSNAQTAQLVSLGETMAAVEASTAQITQLIAVQEKSTQVSKEGYTALVQGLNALLEANTKILVEMSNTAPVS